VETFIACSLGPLMCVNLSYVTLELLRLKSQTQFLWKLNPTKHCFSWFFCYNKKLKLDFTYHTFPHFHYLSTNFGPKRWYVPFHQSPIRFRIHLLCQDGKQWTNLNFNKVFSFKSPCFNELKIHLQSKAMSASSRLVNPNQLIFLWMQQSC
jgi:hypothetical protein